VGPNTIAAAIADPTQTARARRHAGSITARVQTETHVLTA